MPAEICVRQNNAQAQERLIRMDPTARQSEILTLLETEGAVSIAELAGRFDVSDETVRRDVRQLEVLGHVQKVHGGVRLPENIFETPYRQRQHERSEAKQAIGRACAELIPDGARLTMESSTTAFWVARALCSQRNLSVITNGVDVARELCGRNNNRIFLAGGEMSDATLSTLGPVAIAYLKQFTPDMAIIGASGLHAQTGLGDFDMQEAEIARAILETATRTIVIADASKFDRRALVHVCDLSCIDVLVTDQPPEGHLARALAGTEVIVAEG